MRPPGLITALPIFAVAVAGCHGPNDGTTRQSPLEYGSASPAATTQVVPTPRTPVTFGTPDGAAIAGDLYLATNHSAPSLVLVHRKFRDRNEWKPLIEDLRTTDRRYTILAFDLRGEGASKLPPKQYADTAPPHMHEDVQAAIKKVIDATGGSTRAIVLVGSDLGATLVAQVAFEEPKVVALGLISPGMAAGDLDLLHPYADVRNLPTLIASSIGDNVAEEPVGYLSNMAEAKTVKSYQGPGRGADAIAARNPGFWSDLESWLMTVYDEKPSPRQPAYHPKRGRKEATR